jgi:hypothetical protein
MPIRLLLCCLFVFPTVVIADAGDGQFMGYELGKNYPATPRETELTTAGNLLITAENPTKPADIVQVSLVATPESQIVGYIIASSWFSSEGEARAFGRRYVELLRAKYPDWDFGQEKMDENFDLVEVNFNKPPHNIKLSLARDDHDDRSMWRISMGLGWVSESNERNAWHAQATSEHAAAKASEHEQLMEKSDIRGL